MYSLEIDVASEKKLPYFSVGTTSHRVEEDTVPIKAWINVGPDLYREVELSYLEVKSEKAEIVDKFLTFPNFVHIKFNMEKG